MIKKIIFISFIITYILIFSSCAIFKQAVNISRLKFKLSSISNFTLSGISISQKASLRDFSILDVTQLMNNFQKGIFPVSFTLNIEAYNPNTEGGFSRQNIDIYDFKWSLIIDSIETVSGNIEKPISVPGTGETTIFPIRVELDLVKFFKDHGFDGIINLALGLGGKNSNLQRIVLKAQPTIMTPLGKIKYPGEINIVDKEFR